jgi:DNA-directed RNA polymerase beta subunit
MYISSPRRNVYIPELMDPYCDMLSPKPIPEKLKGRNGVKEWENRYKMKLFWMVFQSQGLLQDIIMDFDSALPNIIRMVEELMVSNNIDSSDRLHTIYHRNVYFVRPFESKHGLDDPNRALLRGDYNAECRGTRIYEIRVDPNTEVKDVEGLSSMDIDDPSPEEDEDEDEDEEMIEVDEVEIEPEVDDKTKEDEDEEDDDGEENCFFYDKKDFSRYSKVIYQHTDHNFSLIFDFLAMFRSSICHFSTPHVNLSELSKVSFQGGCFCVNQFLRYIRCSDIFINNRVMTKLFGKGPKTVVKLEYRGKFIEPAKEFRTNCTLYFNVQISSYRKYKDMIQVPRFRVTIPHEKGKKKMIPIGVLAMAFGWDMRRFAQTIRMFLTDEKSVESEFMIKSICIDIENCRNQNDGILRISKELKKCEELDGEDSIKSYAAYTLRGEFFPNLIDITEKNQNYTWENNRKCYCLAQIASEMIRLTYDVNRNKKGIDKWDVSDKRMYRFKRMKTGGQKLCELARKCIKTAVRSASGRADSSLDTNPVKLDPNSTFMAKDIRFPSHIRNGTFDPSKDVKDSYKNQTDMLETSFSEENMYEQNRKVTRHGMKKNSDPTPLQTIPDQWGRIDEFTIPETESCGLIRFRSLGSQMSHYTNQRVIQNLINQIIARNMEDLGFISVTSSDSLETYDYQKYTPVFDIYSGIIGWTTSPYKMYRLFVGIRRQLKINKFLGMEWDRRRNLFFFNCDEGRYMRPLVVTEKLSELVTFLDSPLSTYVGNTEQYLLQHGMIEYLDPNEEYSLTLVAGNFNDFKKGNGTYTHMEIHGAFSLCLTSAKSHAHMNAGTRRGYEGNMSRRVVPMKSKVQYGSSMSISLLSAQKPLISDPVDFVLGLREKEPNSIIAVVGIIATRGNIEDCVEIKKSFVERGGGMTCELKMVRDSLGHSESFSAPTSNWVGTSEDEKYQYLKPDGSPMVNHKYIPGGSAVIGRSMAYKDTEGVTKNRCMSKFTKVEKAMRVDKVDYWPNDKSKWVMRVTLSNMILPAPGNKFKFGNHAQKATMQSLVPEVDMPFVAFGDNAGMTLDVTINVFALARNTNGLPYEIMMGKAACHSPRLIEQYNTLFCNGTFKERLELCRTILVQHGFSSNGRETLCSGKTGRMMECPIFIGPIGMSVLKHIAEDKMRARYMGPMDGLTRQASVGKKADGAQRLGELQGRNMGISRGMTASLIDATYTRADKFKYHHCTRCGIQCIGNDITRYYRCQGCEKTDKIVRVNGAYISNLAFQEMYCGGWGHALVMEKDESMEGLLADKFFNPTSIKVE